VNAPLKAAVRRDLCSGVHKYFQKWKLQRLFAISKKDPLPTFKPPEFSPVAVMQSVMKACGGPLATPKFQASLRQVFVTVGIAPNNSGTPQASQAMGEVYHHVPSEDQLAVVIPPIEAENGEPLPVRGLGAVIPSLSSATVVGGKHSENQYKLSDLVVPVTFETQNDLISNEEHDGSASDCSDSESDICDDFDSDEEGSDSKLDSNIIACEESRPTRSGDASSEALVGLLRGKSLAAYPYLTLSIRMS